MTSTPTPTPTPSNSKPAQTFTSGQAGQKSADQTPPDRSLNAATAPKTADQTKDMSACSTKDGSACSTADKSAKSTAA